MRALVEQEYTGRVLFPIVDPDAVAKAKEIGVDCRGRVSFGGTLDPRYAPLELDVVVEDYRTGLPLMAKGAVGEIATQEMAVLSHGTMVSEAVQYGTPLMQGP